jgi:hypothetical protein
MRTRFRKPLLYPLSYGGLGRRVALVSARSSGGRNVTALRAIDILRAEIAHRGGGPDTPDIANPS